MFSSSPVLMNSSAAILATEGISNDGNINEEELSLYLAVVKTRAELVSLGLGDVTHTRKATRGAAPGITTEEILERTGKTVSKFHKPVRPPTSDEKRKMFATALEVLINQAMENHCYTFNGEIKQQSKGGAIGNILTGSLGALTMVRFTRELKNKLVYAMQDNPDFVLHLLKIYVSR